MFFHEQGSKCDIGWAFSLWCFWRTPCCLLRLTKYSALVKAKKRWGKLKFWMHISACNESCGEVLKTIGMLDKMGVFSVPSCQKLLQCLCWTQCKKQTKQENHMQGTPCLTEWELSRQHGSVSSTDKHWEWQRDRQQGLWKGPTGWRRN